MLFLDTLRRRLLVGGSLALLAILTACGGTADVNEVAPTVPPAPPAQTAPAITTQPAAITVTAPAAATFSVAASGNPTPILQWQVSTDAGATWTNVAGATAATLTISPTSVGQSNYRYRAVATNSAGSVTSNAATLTVNAAAAAPALTTQPADVSVAEPAAATFSVVATGTAPLIYQWQRNVAGTWTNITGATSPNYTTPATTRAADNGAQFRVVISNSAGMVMSNPVTLTVTAGGTGAPWQADQLIAGGGTHTLVVRANGELWSWGTNNAGALGRANASSVNAPSHVTTLGSNVRSVAAGAWYSVALRNDGTVWAWGDGDRVGAAVGAAGAIQLPLQVNGLSNIRAISTRYQHTLALRDDGTLWGFGPENFSALGPIISSGVVRQIQGLSDVRQVAAGEQHSVALLADGSVRTWGSNTLGQLGVNTSNAPRTAPQTVPLTDVVAIAASSFASFALRSDGTLWRWGTIAGTTQTAPTQMSFTGSISALATGNQTLHVLRNDGTVFGMGDNSFGRVGIGTTGGNVTTLSQIGLIGGAVSSIGGGEFHALAVRNDGRVFAWGNNGQRQLSGVVGGDANAPLDTGFTR